ncbi:metal-response element-binding transcription factor 2-like [Ctenocephalides felis]|uniref:metal-response element-binding transcription factor 2-like n=1 Tax=Ctenocephalides felis TaxID=7515 RepID=UPI000E6E1975|nr:metal-response element-binding transcription factor 2-like [Ctenocephalides felis]
MINWTINSVDVLGDQCLVKFGDNTLRWYPSKEINHLKVNKADSGPLCVICKTSEDKEGDKVIVCDKCGRGYHQKCHTPKVLNLNGTWNCRRCVDQTHYIRKMENRNMRREIRRNSTSTTAEIVNSASVIPAPVVENQLPYDLESLTWDAYHRKNAQQTYCYCGGNGEWNNQMLQCIRCRQWFHERCIGCLQYPLYCGDRFYIFVCSSCNFGNEFVRRLETKWVDIVHLLLFNLTSYNNIKYFDLDNVILPYAHDNWHALQLTPQMKDIPLAEMREQILYALSNNKNRFKCGRENKKKVTIWGLRERVPPPAPCISLNFSGVVTDANLREALKGNKRMQFLDRTPVNKSTNMTLQSINSNTFTSNSIAMKRRENIVVPLDSNMISIMKGNAYRQKIAKNSDSDSICSLDDNEDMFKKENDRQELMSADTDVSEDIKIPEARIIESDKKDELKLILKIETSESKLTGSRRRKNLRKSVREDKAKAVCPPTPPTSVSAPPTPPATGSNSNDTNYYVNENSKDSRLEPMDTDSVVHLKSMFDSLKSIRHDRCDSSDETSSRCTLDSIIPPPKNFRGKNNPFHSPPKSTNPDLLKGKNKLSAKKRKNSVVANLFDTRPAARTLKRKLSEKDLLIGENGEVKRKKFRKSRGRNSLPEMSNSTTASKTALFTPLHSTETTQRSLRSSLNVPQTSSTPISNCVDYALNGRRLRQRQDITYAETGRRNSTNGRLSTQISQISQIGQSAPGGKVSDVCMTDLKSSVNVYFGAMNRILNGEKFAVQGRRINSDGKVQYLIEWEGGPS